MALGIFRILIGDTSPQVPFILAAPVVITGLPLLFPRLKLVSAILLLSMSATGFVFWSLALFAYTPVALLLFVPERKEAE